MALLDSGTKVGTTVLIGIGALLIAPAVIPGLGRVIKPLAKAAIKSGLIFIQRGRELLSEAAESLEDITAEVKAEMLAARETSTDQQPE